MLGGDYANGVTGKASASCSTAENTESLYVDKDGNQGKGSKGSELAAKQAKWTATTTGKVVTLEGAVEGEKDADYSSGDTSDSGSSGSGSSGSVSSDSSSSSSNSGNVNQSQGGNDSKDQSPSTVTKETTRLVTVSDDSVETQISTSVSTTGSDTCKTKLVSNSCSVHLTEFY